jgi:hypothetical protein
MQKVQMNKPGYFECIQLLLLGKKIHFEHRLEMPRHHFVRTRERIMSDDYWARPRLPRAEFAGTFEGGVELQFTVCATSKHKRYIQNLGLITFFSGVIKEENGGVLIFSQCHRTFLAKAFIWTLLLVFGIAFLSVLPLQSGFMEFLTVLSVLILMFGIVGAIVLGQVRRHIDYYRARFVGNRPDLESPSDPRSEFTFPSEPNAH